MSVNLCRKLVCSDLNRKKQNPSTIVLHNTCWNNCLSMLLTLWHLILLSFNVNLKIHESWVNEVAWWGKQGDIWQRIAATCLHSAGAHSSNEVWLHQDWWERRELMTNFLCGFIIQPSMNNECAQSFEAHFNHSTEDYYQATGSCMSWESAWWQRMEQCSPNNIR